MGDLVGDTLATAVINEHARLDMETTNWKSHWDEVSQYFVPRKDNVYGQAVTGEKKFNLLYDSEGVRAVDDLASVLTTSVVNPQSIWFGLTTKKRVLKAKQAVIAWLYNATLAMIETFNGTNFQTSMHEMFTDLVSIGTSVVRVEPDDVDVLRFYTQTIYQVVIDEDKKGKVDTVSRAFKWTKKKILEEYGKEVEFRKNGVLEKLGDDMGKEWVIIHMVRPRGLKDQLGRLGSKAFPWASIHVIKDLALTVKESGFEEFPYAVPRWSKLTEEKLGRSPAMKVLSDNKMLQEEKKVFIKGEQLRMGPPLQVPDQGFLTKLKIAPFSTNYKKKGRDDVRELFKPGQSAIGKDLLLMTKEDIRKGFFLNRLHVEVGDRATAQEVIQKRDENLRVLSPYHSRMDQEGLRPIIDRAFGIMYRAGEFGDPPEELQEEGGVQLGVKYMSMIARAQLIIESENFYRAISASEPMISSDPSLLQNIDGDKVLRQNFTKFGNDPGLLRSEKKVTEMREQEQEALRQQAAIEQQKADADSIKKIGDVDARQAG